MTGLSHSTARRLIEPRIAGLVLAALRLRLHLEPVPRLPLSGCHLHQSNCTCPAYLVAMGHMDAELEAELERED